MYQAFFFNPLIPLLKEVIFLIESLGELVISEINAVNPSSEYLPIMIPPVSYGFDSSHRLCKRSSCSIGNSIFKLISEL